MIKYTGGTFLPNYFLTHKLMDITTFLTVSKDSNLNTITTLFQNYLCQEEDRCWTIHFPVKLLKNNLFHP